MMPNSFYLPYFHVSNAILFLPSTYNSLFHRRSLDFVYLSVTDTFFDEKTNTSWCMVHQFDALHFDWRGCCLWFPLSMSIVVNTKEVIIFLLLETSENQWGLYDVEIALISVRFLCLFPFLKISIAKICPMPLNRKNITRNFQMIDVKANSSMYIQL